MNEKHLFESFLKMEEDYSLFNIKGKHHEPIWDLVRVRVFNWYILNNDIINKNRISTISEQIKNILSYIYKSLSFRRDKKYLFIYTPRFFDENGRKYDRIAEDMINFVSGENITLISISGSYTKSKHNDNTLFLFTIIAQLRILFLKLSQSHYAKIFSAIKHTFNIELSYKTINALYRKSMRGYYSYLYCLKYYKPQKMFVFVDEQKGAYMAAKRLGIIAFEVQHGTLVYESPSYSYPKSIIYNSNISYADYYLHPGYGWGINNNIPAKERIVLGNNSFVNSLNTCGFVDDIILIISCLPHCDYLKKFTKKISKIYKGTIIYKLHPEEYPIYEKYVIFFSEYNNIKVAPQNANLSELISKCSLMVTVSSTVYFEAKNIGKRVAVLKYDNYYILEPYVKQSLNSCIIDSWKDLYKAIEMPEKDRCERYYVPFNEEEAGKILKIRY